VNHRIITLVFILLLSLSFRYQDKRAIAAPVKPVGTKTATDRKALISFAKQYLGTTYRPGSMDPEKGFDCSGFVRFVFDEFHVNVPRSSGEYESIGKALSPGDFRVGDVLVFYGYRNMAMIGHVGIICEADGMNSRFIHATSGKAYCVTISELDSEGYRHRFFKCIDVITPR
jgi:cell wall-associated NlpC family hydrolase